MVQCPLAAPAATSVLEGVGDWNAGVLRGRPLRAAEGWVGIWRSDGSLVDHAPSLTTLGRGAHAAKR